jgi:hypothetical protein
MNPYKSDHAAPLRRGLCIFFFSTACFCGFELLGAGVPLETWRPLLSYRPSTSLQKLILDRGVAWDIHHIEDQPSYLNLDYYSLRVIKMPNKQGTSIPMTREDLLRLFSNWIISTKRASSDRISFEPVEVQSSFGKPGSVFLLHFKSFTLTPCRQIAACADIPWLRDGKTCEYLDGMLTKWYHGDINRGYIMISQATPGEIRVATLREDGVMKPGDHPVAGNRAFGVMSKGTEWIVYTIGADRATKAFPMVDYQTVTKPEQMLGEVGYCSAEVFWRLLLAELQEEIVRLGGKAERGLCERKPPIKWDDAIKQSLWNPEGQPSWVKRP